MTFDRSVNFPFSIKPSQFARIQRMAEAQGKAVSELIRDIVLPTVEAWETEQPAPTTTSSSPEPITQ